MLLLLAAEDAAGRFLPKDFGQLSFATVLPPFAGRFLPQDFSRLSFTTVFPPFAGRFLLEKVILGLLPRANDDASECDGEC